jgi:hypothetical protein
MIALTAGNWQVADASAGAHRRECSGLVAAHLQWHLERGLRSLPLVDRASTERDDTEADGTDHDGSDRDGTNRDGTNRDGSGGDDTGRDRDRESR